MAPLILGSRGSALALAQVSLVREALLAAHPGLPIELKVITTSGDRRQEVRAGEGSDAGLKGLFTKEIQDALLDHSIHAAIHSLKDLPGVVPPNLSLAAVLPRADTSDLLISRTPTLNRQEPALPFRVATGSIRRSRQLKWLHPGIEIVDLRGNVPTRLQKLATQSLDAIVLARAGLNRLGYPIVDGLLHCDSGPFHAVPLDILPAIGQGAIGIETRSDDLPTRALFSPICHLPTHLCIQVERELLRLLNGTCHLPVAARATLQGDRLHAQAIIFPDDETLPPVQAQASAPSSDPESLAQTLFHQLRPS